MHDMINIVGDWLAVVQLAGGAGAAAAVVQRWRGPVRRRRRYRYAADGEHAMHIPAPGRRYSRVTPPSLKTTQLEDRWIHGHGRTYAQNDRSREPPISINYLANCNNVMNCY